MAWKELQSEISEMFLGLSGALDQRDMDVVKGTVPVRNKPIIPIRFLPPTRPGLPYLDPAQRRARDRATYRAWYAKTGGYAALPENTKEAKRRACRDYSRAQYQKLSPEERKERNRKKQAARDPAKRAAEQARYDKANRAHRQAQERERRRLARLASHRQDTHDGHVVKGSGKGA